MSLIALGASYASKLTVSSCTFENFFFPYGLISNAYFKWNRNFPYASFMGPQNCRDINAALTAPCYLLTLEENTFTISAKGYSYSSSPKNSPGTVYHDNIEFDGKKDSFDNEGIVLFLQSFPGHVRIYKNTFR